MLSARLENYLLLENKEHLNYVSMAYDEKYFYISTKNLCSIFKIDLSGHIVDVIKAQDVYKSICFDSVEGCFWAIKNNYSQYIFKLNKEFNEIDSIVFRETPYDCIYNIAYKTSDETLLLSGPNFIYNLSKKGEILLKHESHNNNLILSAGEVGKSLIKCTNCTLSSLIVINMGYQNYGGGVENLNCLPNGYKPISIFPSCYSADNNEFFIGTIKNKQFTYLLKYELVNIYNQAIDSKKDIKSSEYYKDDEFICINDINIL